MTSLSHAKAFCRVVTEGFHSISAATWLPQRPGRRCGIHHLFTARCHRSVTWTDDWATVSGIVRWSHFTGPYQ